MIILKLVDNFDKNKNNIENEEDGIFILSPYKNKITPTIDDAKLVEELMDIYIKHAELIFFNLDKSEVKVLKNNTREQLKEEILKIKHTFRIKDLNDYLTKNKITINILKKLLKKMIEQKMIIKVSYGVYRVA